MPRKKDKSAEQKYIYLVFSSTPSRFGRMIRFASGARFNHVSLAFDESLRKLYSFGRRKNNIPINAGLVQEYPERFSLRKVDYVGVKIYRIPVTPEQYRLGKLRIRQILNDEKYLYNLYSVLFYPIFKGFYTYKAYTCVEFVIHMMRFMKIYVPTVKPSYKYLPDELESILESPGYFEGNLLEYAFENSISCGDFFDPMVTYREQFYATGISVVILSKLVYRKVRHSHRLSKIYSLIMFP
ncbi:MAG: hypothetical protein PHG30_00790 [Eubacteriales bacterium]|jgi:hypothetical protein|nr:hypothetical protein [Eubacteriales bacterium]MDD3536707.1 hypothetical protein [Eubacteriales bacterium]MDD4285939.1 hypothetical protein [Eubacteriales bacterium]NLV70900.1 hypothetical protein [Clostridiales bacterium]